MKYVHIIGIWIDLYDLAFIKEVISSSFIRYVLIRSLQLLNVHNHAGVWPWLLADFKPDVYWGQGRYLRPHSSPAGRACSNQGITSVFCSVLFILLYVIQQNLCRYEWNEEGVKAWYTILYSVCKLPRKNTPTSAKTWALFPYLSSGHKYCAVRSSQSYHDGRVSWVYCVRTWCVPEHSVFPISGHVSTQSRILVYLYLLVSFTPIHLPPLHRLMPCGKGPHSVERFCASSK